MISRSRASRRRRPLRSSRQAPGREHIARTKALSTEYRAYLQGQAIEFFISSLSTLFECWLLKASVAEKLNAIESRKLESE